MRAAHPVPEDAPDDASEVHTRPRPARGPLSVAALTRLTALLAIAGTVSIATSLALRSEAPPQPAAATAEPLPPAALTPTTADALPRAVPVHLRLDRVGIDADLIALGLNPDGTLTVPPPTAQGPAGWYQGLASPGEIGPAVIVGHVDSPGGRGAFFNLGAVRRGDRIEVERADGLPASFVVDLVASFSAAEFPTTAVYGGTDRAVLRLITCGGTFTAGEGYDRSVVVFATLA
ncbi:MAG: class F sortase [Sporichthyaceae bacterium]